MLQVSGFFFQLHPLWQGSVQHHQGSLYNPAAQQEGIYQTWNILCNYLQSDSVIFTFFWGKIIRSLGNFGDISSSWGSLAHLSMQSNHCAIHWFYLPSCVCRISMSSNSNLWEGRKFKIDTKTEYLIRGHWHWLAGYTV